MRNIKLKDFKTKYEEIKNNYKENYNAVSVYENGEWHREDHLLTGLGARLRDVRQGPDGRLYLLTDERDGDILRVDPA